MSETEREKAIEAIERLLREYKKIINDQAETIERQNKVIDILSRELWNDVSDITSVEHRVTFEEAANET